MKQKKAKTIMVLNPMGNFMSYCTLERAEILLDSERADKIKTGIIRLKETKRTRKNRKKKIIQESERRCYICGKIIPINDSATIDHVIPKSINRLADVYENMKCCCERCNKDKRNMTPNDYIIHILQNRNKYEYLSDNRIAYLKKMFAAYQSKLNTSNLTIQKASVIND